MNDPPLLIYQQTCDATLTDPRPGPRHALRAFPRPDLRRLFMDSHPAPDDADQWEGVTRDPDTLPVQDVLEDTDA